MKSIVHVLGMSGLEEKMSRMQHDMSLYRHHMENKRSDSEVGTSRIDSVCLFRGRGGICYAHVPEFFLYTGLK